MESDKEKLNKNEELKTPENISPEPKEDADSIAIKSLYETLDIIKSELESFTSGELKTSPETEVDFTSLIPKNPLDSIAFNFNVENKLEEIKSLFNQYYSRLISLIKEISSIPLDKDISKASLFKSLVETARKVILTLNTLLEERKQLILFVKKYNEKKLENVLKSVGIGTKKEADEEYEKIRDDLWSLENKFLGLGQLFFLNNIRELRKRKKSLQVIRDIEDGEVMINSDEIRNFNLESNIEYIKRDFSSTIFNSIEKVFNYAINYFDSSENLGDKKEIDEILKNKLFDELFNVSVKPELLEIIVKEVTDDEEEKMALVEKVRSIFTEGAIRDIYSETYKDEEDYDKKVELKKQISDLPEGVGYFLRQILMYTIPNFKWEDFSKLVSENSKKEFLKYLISSIEKMRETLNRQDTTGYYRSNITNIIYEINSKFFNPDKKIDFDSHYWKIFKGNAEVEKKYGKDLLEKSEKSIEDSLLMALCNSDEQNDARIIENLIDMRSIKSLPIILLDIFRVGGERGGRYLIRDIFKPKDTVIYKFLNSLTLEEKEEIGKMNIPGLMETISTILNNGENFSSFSVESDSDKHEYIKNPVYLEIEDRLMETSCFLLEHGNKSEKTFVVRTLAYYNHSFDKQYEWLDRTLKNTLSEGLRLKDSVVDMLTKKFGWLGDIESLELIVSNYDSFDKGDFNKIFRTIIRTFEGAHNDSNTLAKIKPIIEKLIRHLGTVENKETMFIIHNLASRFDIDFKKLSADEIIGFFNRSNYPDEISLENDKAILIDIVKMCRKIEFSKQDSYRILLELIKNLGNLNFGYLSSNHIREIKDFVTDLSKDGVVTEELKNKINNIFDLKTEWEAKGLLSGENIKIDENNWSQILRAYVISEGGGMDRLGKTREILSELFSDKHPENRDFCLEKLKLLWGEYLKNPNVFPTEALIVCDAIEKTERAGDLKYISSLGNIMNIIKNFYENKDKSIKNKKSVIEGMIKQEERMSGWSEDDKALFYNISNNVMKMAPSLYSNFFEIFEVMGAKELLRFLKELFPLYQANLIVLEKEGGGSDPKELLAMRKRLKLLKDNLQKEKSDFKEVLSEAKTDIIEEIKKSFKIRFGLLKVPEELTEENLRTVKNFIRYIGNVNGRDEIKENILSLFLGLSINGEWENFRAGGQVKIDEILDEKRVSKISEFLDKRTKIDFIPKEAIGLTEEEIKGFEKMLQDEVLTSTTGNVETVDNKLITIKNKLSDLTDPDIYTEESERKILELLILEDKNVGLTLSKIFGELNNKKINFSDKEKEIKEKLENIYNIDKWTTDIVVNIQKGIESLSLIVRVSKEFEKLKVDEELEKLRKILIPTEEIVKIFNSIGEDFKPTSGAMAVSQDLSYLENIVVKNSNKFSQEQKQKINDYISSIRAQMNIMEDIYEKLISYFEKISSKAKNTKNEILRSRIDEIRNIISRKDDAVSVLTTMTNNFNLIIENMRQCLGCLKKEINNDTNLTFGDPNKFYLLSQKDKEIGSLSDEVVFFVPVKLQDGSQEMSFVLDKMYDVNSLDLTFAHIKTVIKKMSILKKQFPEAKISVFVTKRAMAATTREKIEEKLDNEIKNTSFEHVDKATALIPESSWGEHYIEFSSNIGGREIKGNAEFSGLRILID